MGAPYNQLQQLVFYYSGREIGVVQYNPYTFSNEKDNLAISVYGSVFKAIPETSSRIKASVSSGQAAAGLIDRFGKTVSHTGQMVAQPVDRFNYSIYATGSQKGYPADVFSSRFYPSGGIIDTQRDNIDAFGINGFSGVFDPPVSDLPTYSLSFTHAEVVKTAIDLTNITFVMFTGSYISGLFTPPPQNYPLTGTDQTAITFVMFTGSYQGS